MKTKHYSINIKKPCSENWSSFDKTKEGGFCDACKKNVIDFTNLNASQISQLILNSNSRICGRFHQDQLSHIYSKSKDTSNPYSSSLLKIGLTSIGLLLFGNDSWSAVTKLSSSSEAVQIEPTNDQSKTVERSNDKHKISGTVIDEFGDSLPGVSINLKGSSIGTISDIEGKFEFPSEVNSGDILVFSFIGMETQEYCVRKDEPLSIVLNMIMDQYYLLGEISVEEVYSSEPRGLKNIWSKIKGLF